MKSICFDKKNIYKVCGGKKKKNDKQKFYKTGDQKSTGGLQSLLYHI